MICISTILIIAACSSAPKKNEPASKIAPQETPKTRIAIVDLKPDGIKASEARKISELLRTDLINTGQYIVIERSQIDALLKEHGFAQIGVTDESSAVKLGRMLAAQKILIGTAMKLGDSIVITGRVVDIEKGIAERGARVAVKKEEDLIDSASDFMAQLTGRHATVSEGQHASPQIIIRTKKKFYARGEEIIVMFSNFPGTKYDYISLAKKTAPPSDLVTYQYTNKLKEGTVVFPRGLYDPGEYEVRAYTEYHKGNKNYQSNYFFTVR